MEATTAEDTFSPFLLTTAGALGGILLTFITGLITIGINSRRDHRRWVREKRFEAYVTFDQITAQITNMGKDSEAKSKRLKEIAEQGVDDENSYEYERLTREMKESIPILNELMSQLTDADTAVKMLGPKSVIEAIETLQDGDPYVTRHRTQIAMREALNIKFDKRY